MGFTRADLLAYRDRTVDDLVGEGCKLLFVGINPGLWTAATGAHFARPGNRFYPALARATGASAVPVLTAVGLAVVIAIVAWAPKFTRASVQVDLAPGVSSPLSGEPAFILDPGIFPVQEPVLDLQKGLWSDPNALLFEYSSMRERYRTRDLLRQTESEF